MNSGNSSLHFDGSQSYIEIPDSPDFSLTTTGSLTVSAWIRPATLTFPSTEGKGVDFSKAYVHWLGKGGPGQQEWVFRMYSADNSVQRENRISFYVFKPEGGLGIGSHYQDANNPIQAGVWIHVVGAADTERTYLSINGQPVDSDPYAGQIQPQRGTDPFRIGTRDFNSYFEGEIRGVRVWNRLLSDAEIAGLFASDAAPTTGLVAEYLLTQDIAPDTTGDHNGPIIAGIWLQGD
jgi:Concanavalin A-like lectin/glucanases superfamily